MEKERDSNRIVPPKEYFIIEVPKQKIALTIMGKLKEENLSYRKAADLIPNLNYSQFTRVTSGANYTIETLLRTLSALDLEIEIKKKS